MAKTPQFTTVHGVGDGRYEADDNHDGIDIKYKEIKDKNMPRARHESANINAGVPNNGDSNSITPIFSRFNRHNSELEDQLADRDTVPCPTCRGAGAIHADDSSLVALIPVKDERLKPKRTKLKIIIAIILTLLICGVTVYFLFPRSPTLKLISVAEHNASFSKTGDQADIVIKTHYLVKNNNFVSVDLTSISVDVTWRNAQVGGPHPVYEFQTKEVGIRSSTNFDVYIRTTYSKADTAEWEFFNLLCQYRDLLNLQINTEIETSFSFHSEKITSSDEKWLLCVINGTSPV